MSHKCRMWGVAPTPYPRHPTPFFLIFCLLILTSCGYRIAGLHESRMSSPVAIAIPFFDNLTEEPIIEEVFTPSVRREFIRDGHFPLVNSGAADRVLTGRITRYKETPLSFDRSQNVLEYRVAITTEVELKSRTGQSAAWFREISATAEYPVTSDVMATRLAKRKAIEEAARNLAEELMDRVREGY